MFTKIDFGQNHSSKLKIIFYITKGYGQLVWKILLPKLEESSRFWFFNLIWYKSSLKHATVIVINFNESNVVHNFMLDKIRFLCFTQELLIGCPAPSMYISYSLIPFWPIVFAIKAFISLVFSVLSPSQCPK